MTNEVIATQALKSPRAEVGQNGARMVRAYAGEHCTVTIYSLPDGEVFVELNEDARCVLYLRGLRLATGYVTKSSTAPEGS